MTQRTFGKFLQETPSLSDEQTIALRLGEELEKNDYKLNDSEEVFKYFKDRDSKFEFSFSHNEPNKNVTLLIENKRDGKYDITLKNPQHSSTEQIFIRDFNQDSNKPSSYMKERLSKFNSDPMSYKFSNPLSNNFPRNNIRSQNIAPETYDFRSMQQDYIPHAAYNVGYDDLHGGLPNNFFGPGLSGGIRGNLMGPEFFRGNVGQPGIRYDPITPFGPGFDFIPHVGAGIGKGSNDLHGFGGGYNPFI